MFGEDKLKVIVRVRPEIPNDAVQSRLHNVSNKICVHTYDDHMITIEKDPFHFRDFTFEELLGAAASQEDAYVRSCQGIVENFTRDGDDGCILCYGQSGSGKTFTMFGDVSSTATDSSFGLVQHGLRDIFTYIGNCQGANFEAIIYVSFYEIYLEKFRDLLAPDTPISSLHQDVYSNTLSIREVPGKGACVEGLTRVQVTDFESGVKLIREMKHKRTSKKRQSNSASSRSHAVLRITMEHVMITSQGKICIVYFCGNCIHFIIVSTLTSTSIDD
jgi:hypothetical protein